MNETPSSVTTLAGDAVQHPLSNTVSRKVPLQAIQFTSPEQRAEQLGHSFEIVAPLLRPCHHLSVASFFGGGVASGLQNALPKQARPCSFPRLLKITAECHPVQTFMETHPRNELKKACINLSQ